MESEFYQRMTRKAGKKAGNGRGLSEGSQRGWFKPGVSGNPKGLRKEVSDASFAVLTDVVAPDRWRNIVEQWTKRAERGDLRAIESLANRLIGAVSTPEESELNDTMKEFLGEFFAVVARREAGGLERGELPTESVSTPSA